MEKLRHRVQWFSPILLENQDGNLVRDFAFVRAHNESICLVWSYLVTNPDNNQIIPTPKQDEINFSW